MIIYYLLIGLLKTAGNAKDWTLLEIILLPLTVIFGTVITRLVLTFQAKDNVEHVPFFDVLKSVFVLWDDQVIQDLLKRNA